MANYNQWRALFPEKKRLMWITGDETCLVEEVLEAEIKDRSVDDLNYVSFIPTKDVSEIVDALSQFARVDTKRLIVIRDANKIKKWDKIIEWSELLTMRDSHLICVSNEDPDTKEERFQPFIKRGRFVECRKLNKEQVIEYIKLCINIDTSALNLLLSFVVGDFSKLRNEVLKLKYLDKRIEVEDVQRLVSQSYEENMVADLFLGDKKKVIEQLGIIKQSDATRILGSLEYKIRQMALLLSLKGKDLHPKEVVERTGIPYFLIGEYYQLVKFVDIDKIIRWFKLLAQADFYIRKGIWEGVLERLISQW